MAIGTFLRKAASVFFPPLSIDDPAHKVKMPNQSFIENPEGAWKDYDSAMARVHADFRRFEEVTGLNTLLACSIGKALRESEVGRGEMLGPEQVAISFDGDAIIIKRSVHDLG